MFRKIQQSVLPSKGNNSSSSSSLSANNNSNISPTQPPPVSEEEDDERTSLLSSSNALPPPPPPPPKTTTQLHHPHHHLLLDYNEKTTTSIISIEEMERGAKLLLRDNIGDSDSVNNLLKGEEDEYSISSSVAMSLYGDDDDDNNEQEDDKEEEDEETKKKKESGSGGGSSSTLTQDDLEYLTSTTKQQQQQQQQQQDPTTTTTTTTTHHQPQQRRNKRGSSRRSTNKKRIVDEIGNQLLEAHGNADLEHDILRKSLNLGGGGGGGGSSSTGMSSDIAALLLLQQQQDRSDEKGGGVENDNEDEDYVVDEEGLLFQRGVLLERIHESTRKLRAASIDAHGGGGGGGGGGGIGSGGQLPPEIEKFLEEEEEEYEEQRKRMVRQVLTMVAVTAFLILLVCAALTLGTIAVGPPKQPMGEYKIIEAQVGHDFWQYYDFYAGKDSAGSNGHIMYVSEQKAREEGIVGVVTETVGFEDMIEIYEDDDPRAEENWLAEDLAFVDMLKRKKLDEELEREREKEKEEEEEAEKKKTKTMKDKVTTTEKTKTDNSDSSSTATANNDKRKQTEDSVKKEKKASRLLQEEQDGEQQQQQQPASPGLNVLGASNDETEEDGSASAETETADTPKPPRLEPFNPDPISDVPQETFVVISSTPTPEGPRNSIRLEGRRRFNRGLFIIDLRHMPAGCGTWPAFWLTDEANWPVNGEIDIVEGVNYQDTAKTALHTTRECRMDDVPEGSKTGTWDTAVGIPDRKTGIPDMTFRYAQDCFVYDPHQWINQGCVASDLKLEGRSLGVPLNQNGGGVYALEWDPVYKHIKTWVFSPHGRVPSNLRDALRTARNEDESTRVAPDTNQWGLPYGHFPIGDGTNCPAEHFRNMRLVINLAFCGSVAGNRYFMDCPKQFKKFKTCEQWVESNPDELKEAYWKIRGVYVYEREWQQQWS